MSTGIYLLINKINGKKYFGQTIDLERREKQYFNQGAFPNDHLKNSFNKYGKENFEFQIIKYCKEKYLDRFEKLYIRVYDTQNREKGYNKESGGNLNKHLSDETKQKLSESHKGQEPWNKDKPCSEKTKEKISETLTGRNLSEEHKQNISESHKDLFVGKNSPKWKNYPRITKKGFIGGKQQYAIRYKGKTLKVSVYLHKLYKWWGENYPNELLYLEI